MFHEDTWIIAAPDPAAVGINLTTDMKRALITENHGVRKSLIVLYPMNHLHAEFLTNHIIGFRKVLTDGIISAVAEVTPEMLRSVRQEIDCRWDVCRITSGNHIEP
jgi:hypothetical protein